MGEPMAAGGFGREGFRLLGVLMDGGDGFETEK